MTDAPDPAVLAHPHLCNYRWGANRLHLCDELVDHEPGDDGILRHRCRCGSYEDVTVRVMTGAELVDAYRDAMAPARLKGTRPGCAAGTWLAACERPRYATGGVISGLVIHHAHPPAAAPIADAFDAGRAYERRRR